MATVGALATWADITGVLTIVNSARTKHGLTTYTLTQTTLIDDANYNSMITALTEANNAITGTKPVMNIAAVTGGTTIITAAQINSLSAKATEVYNTCTCVAYCACYCNDCSCDCDRCTCNCDFCNCLYDCACDPQCSCYLDCPEEGTCSCHGQGTICTSY